MKYIPLISILLLLTGCYRTENGLVIVKPDYEKRNIQVTGKDLKILLRANALLANANTWSRSSERECSNREPYSLYCALKKSSIEIDGRYVHRQPALQEVRFAIDDLYRNSWKSHRLADFNSNKETTFSDIEKVLSLAIERVSRKLQK